MINNTIYNPFSLKGKKILVTGASSGIGRATAIECSRMGATLFITGRDKERLNQTFKELEGDGHVQIIADLTNNSQTEHLVDSLTEIDGVVHSAGVIPDSYISTFLVEEEDIIPIIKSNLIQVINLNSLLIQNRKLKKGGSIVHISSIIVKSPVICFSPYSISKGALLPYSKTLAAELTVKSIRVNTVLPAIIDTDMIKTTFGKQYINTDKDKYPFGYGQPEDVAWMCVYLLSDASRWITGSEFDMDGGYTLK